MDQQLLNRFLLQHFVWSENKLPLFGLQDYKENTIANDTCPLSMLSSVPVPQKAFIVRQGVLFQTTLRIKMAKTRKRTAMSKGRTVQVRILAYWLKVLSVVLRVLLANIVTRLMYIAVTNLLCGRWRGPPVTRRWREVLVLGSLLCTPCRLPVGTQNA